MSMERLLNPSALQRERLAFSKARASIPPVIRALGDGWTTPFMAYCGAVQETHTKRADGARLVFVPSCTGRTITVTGWTPNPDDPDVATKRGRTTYSPSRPPERVAAQLQKGLITKL